MALLRHLTNSKIMGPFVQSQHDAWLTYDKFMADPRIIFLSEPRNLEPKFRTLTGAPTRSHALWTDAYLASFVFESGARMVTLDSGFSRFDGLNVLTLT